MLPLRDTIPSRRTPWVTRILIGVNVSVLLWELTLPEAALSRLFLTAGLVPGRYTRPDWALAVGLVPLDPLPLLTSIFLHGGLLHLVANMWTLWIFGDNVEDRMGPLRYLAFYLAMGVAAGSIHLLSNPGSTVPTVGASGAVAGVLGAYLALYPKARIITLVPIFFWPFLFELPAVVFLLLWFAVQLWNGALAASVGAQAGVAWWAHVGGFVVGLGSYRFFLRHRRRG